MKAFHFEITSRLCSVRIYGEHPNNPSAAFQVFIDGGVGHAFALGGKDFFESISQIGGEIFDELEVSALELYMLEPAFRGLRAALRRKFEVKDLGIMENAGRKMHHISIRKLHDEV